MRKDGTAADLVAFHTGKYEVAVLDCGGKAQ
jgi:hypothetical protein